MSELYLFSQDDKLLDTLTDTTGLLDTHFREELNRGSTFTFTVDGSEDPAQHVIEENQVVFRDKEGDLRLFVIKEIDDTDGMDGPQTTATCEPAFMELRENIIDDRRFVNQTAIVALNAALNGTRWTGTVELSLGNATTNFYYIDSVEAIWDILSNWGGEFKDVVEFEGNKITARKIIIKQRRGVDRGKRFEIDHDIEEIQRTVLSYPITAIYGRGSSLEIEDEAGELTGGHTRLINFENIEWKKSNGAPVDKPKGQKWVGDPDALLEYGRLHEGKLIHRQAVWVNGDYEDPLELLWATWEQLQATKKPEVNYQMSVYLLEQIAGYEHEKVELGDTSFAIDRDFSRPIEIQARVIAIEYDVMDIENTAVVEMGQFLSVHDNDLRRDIDDLKVLINRPSRPITGGSFPDIVPGKPVNVDAVGGFRVIQLYWDYDSHVYVSNYEIFGSQVADFVPDAQHLLYRGKVSGFAHEVDTNQLWYYYIRSVNTRGSVSEFSSRVSAATVRIDGDIDIAPLTITNKLIAADINADKLNAGAIRGIDIYGAKFRSASGTDWMEIVGGDIHLEQSSGRKVNINSDGMISENPDGTKRFEIDRYKVRSNALMAYDSNVYLAPRGAINEVRVVNEFDVEGGSGEIEDYRYQDIRANRFIGNGLYANYRKGITHIELRPAYENGEVRMYKGDTATSFSDVRASDYFGHVFNINGQMDGVRNIYIRPHEEVRFTKSETTDKYVDTRMDGAYVSHVTLNGHIAQDNLYVRAFGEVQATAVNSTTVYIPFRGSAFHQASSIEYKTNIENIKNIGLDIINSLTVLEYDLKADIENGITDNRQLGFIAEYSKSIATQDNAAIDLYKLTSYNTKAIQEVYSLAVSEIQTLKNEIDKLKGVS